MTASEAVSTSSPSEPIAARTRRVPGRTRLDFCLDAALLVAFILDYSFQFTGLTVHEWIGLGLAPVLLVHITLHWDWVARTTRRLFGRRTGGEAIRWGIDLASGGERRGRRSPTPGRDGKRIIQPRAGRAA